MKKKMKTNKAASKRFKTLASGKVKRKGAFGRHIMKTKNSVRLRRIKETQYVHPADMANIDRLLPHG